MTTPDPDLRARPVASRSGTALEGIQFDWLDRLAFAYLALPVLIFVCGWLSWWAALPLVVLLVWGSREWFIGSPSKAAFAGRRSLLLGVVAIALTWSALGGAGHFFFANFDWVTRDTVLRDLVVGTWPVGYGRLNGTDLLLRAPLGYYLPAALAGKVFGLQWADFALWLWTALGVAIFLGVAVSRTRGWTAALLTIAVLVLFGGMDLLGTVLRGGLTLAGNLQITDHLEWWGERYQYSSHATQLYWVPNHALAGWIATALLVRHVDRPMFARALPMLVALLPIWSPLTAVGFALLAGAWWLQQIASARSMTLVDPWALLAGVCTAAVTGAYLTLRAGSIQSGTTAVAGEAMWFFVPHVLQFVLLEAGILWLLLLTVRRDLLLVVAGLVLWLLPLVTFGPGNDLAMRGSIPSLVILALATAEVLAEPTVARQRRVFWPILIVLALGAAVPVMETARAISEPAWRPDYSKSLVPAPSAGYPPHYVATLGNGWVQRLLRPVGNVNAPAGSPPAGDEVSR